MKSKLQRVLEVALGRIKPPSDTIREALVFVKDLNRRLAAQGLAAKAMIGGSAAKGTFLRNDHDIDIFVRFDKKTHVQDSLSTLLAKALSPDAERIHGSRDYFRLRKDNYEFEIIPVLAVKKASEAHNVTDMSPLHVTYVKKHLSPQLRDEVRLVKQFCKAIKVYGAESYINGFSGHILDLLIIRYKGFLQLLRAARGWGRSVVIDLEGHHKRPEFSIDRSKRLGPLLLVEPVDAGRNAAAALSREKYDRFIDAAKAFLNEPALKYFTVKPLTPARIRKEYETRKAAFTQKTRLFILKSVPHEGKTDVVATKLLKAHEHLARMLAQHDFSVLDSGFEYEKAGYALSYLVVENKRHSPHKEHIGPPTKATRDAKRFVAKHTKAYERKGRLYAMVKREHTTPLQVLKQHLKDSYVTERAADMRLVR